ncbi:MAG: DNA photolyase [Deltaproteobacteria bacterium]|nr:DNA photolyase [Deltaproteobacteria bacterium]
MGKDVLHLLKFPGAFFKPCPGTREYICCGYQILNLATNCPLDCSYCVLQAYINQPNLRVFVNYEEALQQSLDAIDAQPERVFRVGTGEFTDSLALDPLTGWTNRLVSAFSRRKNAVLELKTKTTAIKGVLASEQRDRIILSWSLNSPYIVSREEHGAPGLRKRLEAARTCQREGFVLGFHFDPLIPHRGWRDGYLRTMELLDRYIDPRGIIWISLGALRFMPALKSIIRLRHPHTTILDGEFITGLDGKRRYFKPIRMDLYGFLRENLEAWHSDLGLYLCMESDDVWKKSMGWSPTDSQGLGQYLDARVGLIFGGHD